MSLIQSTDKSVLLKNQNFLYNKYVRLYNEVCLLKGLLEDGEGGGGIGVESDPIFTASPAFGITSANITQWNSNVGGGVTPSNTVTLTNKTLSGSDNVFSNIPYSALTGVPSTDLSNYVDRTTAQNILGRKTFLDYPLFNDSYANGQATFGQTNQAARIIFNNGTNGAASLIIGYTSATGAIPEIRSTATAGLSFSTTNASAPMWFTTGGSESARILANGNFLIGNTVDNGQKLQITGGISLTGNIVPVTDLASTLGTTTLKFATIVGGQIIGANSPVYYGNANSNQPIYFRQGSTSQIVGGSYLTTGNWFFQAPGIVTTDTGQRVQIAGTTLLGGDVTLGGEFIPDGNGTRNIGSTANRLAAIWSINSWSLNYLSSSSAFFGTSNIPSQIGFRQGAGSNLIGGFYGTTGNFTLQASGTTLGTDTGERLQVEGTSRFGGAITVSGSILSSTDNTNNIGSSTNRFANGFISNIISPGTLTLNPGGAGFGIQFRQNASNLVVGGFYPTSGNFYIQAPGVITSDTGQKLQVAGTSLLGGTIDPGTNATYDLGTASNRWLNLFAARIASGTSSQTLSFNSDGTTNSTYMVAYPTSRNIGIQTPGAITTDTGQRLQVTGTSLFTGDQSIVGNSTITGNLTVSGTLGFSSLSLSGTLGVTGITTLGGSLLLRAGTATAGTSPLKFTSGPVLTTPEVGAQEFLTDDFYGTITTGGARKKFVMADATAGLTTGRVPYTTTNGRLLDGTTFLFNTTAGGRLSVGTTGATANLNVGATATATGTVPLVIFTGAAHTNQTLSTELTDINFNLARTVQFATGSLALQRAFRIQAPTYGFVGASTITKASTVSISGAPVAGTNATITAGYALEVESGNTLFAGNLTINNIPALGTVATNVLVSNGGVVSSRTLTQLITDIGVSAAPRVVTVASSATITPNVDTTDQYNVTALATAATFAAPAGTYVDGSPLMIRITSDGTARALTWNAIYRGGSEISLPTTTVASRTMYIQFVYNAFANKFDLVGTTGGLT